MSSIIYHYILIESIKDKMAKYSIILPSSSFNLFLNLIVTIGVRKIWTLNISIENIKMCQLNDMWWHSTLNGDMGL